MCESKQYAFIRPENRNSSKKHQHWLIKVYITSTKKKNLMIVKNLLITDGNWYIVNILLTDQLHNSPVEELLFCETDMQNPTQYIFIAL